MAKSIGMSGFKSVTPWQVHAVSKGIQKVEGRKHSNNPGTEMETAVLARAESGT